MFADFGSNLTSHNLKLKCFQFYPQFINEILSIFSFVIIFDFLIIFFTNFRPISTLKRFINFDKMDSDLQFILGKIKTSMDFLDIYSKVTDNV